MILILAHEQDAHATAVEQRLQQRGQQTQRLCARTAYSAGLYAMDPLQPSFAQGQVFASWRGGSEADPTGHPGFTAIYWRRPFPQEAGFTFSHPVAEEIARVEAWQALRLSLEALPSSFFPLGHPLELSRASNKLLQLQLAAQLGFQVPATRVGNDPAAMVDFLTEHPRVVVKPLHASTIYSSTQRSQAEQLIWCRGFSADTLRTALAGRDSAQLMLQQAVRKVADWRITVLPQAIFAVEIDTSTLSEDEPDWRKRTEELPHRLIHLPAAFETQLRAYLAALRLTAGYFDFALHTDGTPWFLEVNTNAQWLWMEQKLGCPISAAIAAALAGS
jgi:hypothetical protein